MYRATRALRLVLGDGMGAAARVLREHFEEEMRYLLVDGHLHQLLGDSKDFFALQTRLLMEDVRRITLDSIAQTKLKNASKLPP